MSIFVVVAPEPSSALQAAIDTKFSGQQYRLNSTSWLVSGRGTAKDISDFLGVTAGLVGNAFITRMDGYFGRYSKDAWEWIKAKLEEPVGG
jgi:hypothetical protein